MKRGVIIGLMIMCCFNDLAQAGNSLSLSMSCTIPAIPGVNVPLIEEETLKPRVDTAKQEKVEPTEEPKPQAPSLIQEDAPEDKTINEGQNELVMVKTVYGR